MQKQESLNIYLEQFIANERKEEVWGKFINSKEFHSLFVENTTKFSQGMTGGLIWRKFLVLKVLGDFEVESYKKDMHLLLKISSKDFSSLLLITTEENSEGVLLRLDHRSFFGKNKDLFQTLFEKRWKKLLKSFEPKNKQDA